MWNQIYSYFKLKEKKRKELRVERRVLIMGTFCLLKVIIQHRKMERQQKQRVIFKCRRVKSRSSYKMNQEEINNFKKNYFHQKIPNVKPLKKRQSLIKISNHENIKNQQRSTKKMKEGTEDQNNVCGDCDSKATRKRQACQKNKQQDIINKLCCDQERILHLLQEVVGGKQINNVNSNLDNSYENLEDHFQKDKNYQLRIQSVTNQNFLEEPHFNCTPHSTFKTIDRNILKPNFSKFPQLLERFIKSTPQKLEEQKSERKVEELRKLISYRLYGRGYSYSCFAQNILNFEEQMSLSEFSQILLKAPFSLPNHQIQIILRELNCKNMESKSALKVAHIAQMLRKLIIDFPKGHNREMKIISLKKFLSLKKNQILSTISQLFLSDYIHINKINYILKEFRLNTEEIDLLQANICVYFTNIAYLPYKQIFSELWINQMT